MNTDLDGVLGERLRPQRERGVAQPVFALLSPQVPRARAVYEASRGEALEVPAGKGGLAVLLPLPLAEAARLFRDHTGEGGAVAAGVPGDGIPADYWLAVLAPEQLHLLAFREGKEAF